MAVQQKRAEDTSEFGVDQAEAEQALFLVSTTLKINGDHEESPDELSAGENASE